MTSIDDRQKTGRIVWLSVIIVILVWALTFLLFLFSDFEKQGQFGDMFGAVNALFSGLAFTGLIFTLILQRKELTLQREDLQLTREELRNQRKEFEAENKTFRYQRLENLFYNMMSLQQKIVDGLRAEYDTEDITTVPLQNGGQGYESRNVHRELEGREVFRYIFEDEPFIIKLNSGQKQKALGIRSVLHSMGIIGLDSYWSPTQFDHYFRHLYTILQFVETQDITSMEAYKYAALFRGTLSRHELVWLYYYALLPKNRNLKALIEKYSFLKYLRPELLTITKEASVYYSAIELSKGDKNNSEFSFNDFEFYLTDNPKEDTKYQLTAFWDAQEIDEGRTFINSWKSYYANKRKNNSEH